MSWGGNTIARSLALVTVATGAAFVDWGFRPIVTTLAPPKQDEPGDVATPPAPDNGEPAAFDPNTLGTEIGTEDAYQLWLGGMTTFIDARPQHEYVEGHIPFAFLVPPDSLGDGRLGDMMELGGVFPEMRVVVYCEGGNCDGSHLVALNLQAMGFTKVHIDIDGYPSWLEAGYEIETGPDAVLGELP